MRTFGFVPVPDCRFSHRFGLLCSFQDTLTPSSCGYWNELAHAHEVKRCERKGEEGADMIQPANFDFADSADNLLPSEISSPRLRLR